MYNSLTDVPSTHHGQKVGQGENSAEQRLVIHSSFEDFFFFFAHLQSLSLPLSLFKETEQKTTQSSSKKTVKALLPLLPQPDAPMQTQLQLDSLGAGG
jgi:hypothetical protein